MSMSEAEHTRISLRAELGVPDDPDFDLMLPPGWERRPVSEEEKRRMLSGMRSRFMAGHRPDLQARMQPLVEQAFEQMRRMSTVAMFMPAPDASDALYLPASLTASVRHAGAEEDLDDLVRAAVRDHGAKPLFDDKRFMRFERDEPLSLDGETAGATTVVYLTPVPGSKRRRALQLTLVVLRPADAPVDDPPMIAIKSLFDMCVSTLSWGPAPASR